MYVTRFRAKAGTDSLLSQGSNFVTLSAILVRMLFYSIIVVYPLFFSIISILSYALKAQTLKHVDYYWSMLIIQEFRYSIYVSHILSPSLFIITHTADIRFVVDILHHAHYLG